MRQLDISKNQGTSEDRHHEHGNRQAASSPCVRRRAHCPLDGTQFKDMSKPRFVGIYPTTRKPTSWKAAAQRTVDNAQMRYFIVHMHRLMDPEHSRHCEDGSAGGSKPNSSCRVRVVAAGERAQGPGKTDPICAQTQQRTRSTLTDHSLTLEAHLQQTTARPLDNSGAPGTERKRRFSFAPASRALLGRFCRDWIWPRWRQILVALLLTAGLAATTGGYPLIIKHSFDSPMKAGEPGAARGCSRPSSGHDRAQRLPLPAAGDRRRIVRACDRHPEGGFAHLSTPIYAAPHARDDRPPGFAADQRLAFIQQAVRRR